MKTSIRNAVGLVFATLLCLPALQGSAFHPPAHEVLPNLDRRPRSEVVTAAASSESAVAHAALAALKTSTPDVRVTVGDRPEVKWIRAERGFLTGPGGQGRSVSGATLATFATNETHLPTKAFVREHAALFGFGPEVLAQARVKREFVTPHNGLQTVVWQQELDGIAIFESVFISHTTKRGELVNVASQFVPTPVQAAKAGLRSLVTAQHPPNISAAKAVALAARNIGAELEDAGVTPASAVAAGAEQKQQFDAAPLAGPAEARLIWVPVTADNLQLCWEVTLTSRARGELYRLLVDVENGEILIRHCSTEYISDASYRVFLSDSPSPFSPSCATPCTTQPPVLASALVTLSAVDTNASPNGWIDDGGNETRGNNVDAHTDLNADNSADLPRPQGSPFRTFDFTANLTQAPATYTNAAVTDLFYWCNWMHDKLYDLGFTEAAGNFQNNNFGRGGLGNDALQADAQDGSGVNNANMSTPSDGSAPRMQMFVFTGPTPDRDGDFDHEIVLHEYTHGLSNRRVGGGVGMSASQSRGMGEGWSDWYGLALLSESGDDVNGVYAAGGYATYQFSGLTQNYYYGIRRYPYCTDMTKNPLTFRDIDPAQASTHTGVPRSPIIGNTANEVHNQGEVWCVALWEARASLIAKHGFAVGNQMILQLVTDGMNLSPANPNFLQARDAILQADVVNHGGANLPELWAAFAKRGMGYSATSPSSSTTTGVVEAYDIPDSLVVTPGAGLTGVGPVGGPFSPNAINFSLVNIGTNALNWAASPAPTWLTISPSSGVIAAGGSNQVSVTVNAAANLLPLGVYASTLRFTNVSSGVAHARGFTLRVGQPDYFTELFDAGDNDLDNQTLTFTPNGSASYYSVCREPATTFPTAPTSGTNINLGSHTYSILNLASNISIYGFNASTLYVASEGHITLLSGDSSGTMTLANHFSRPRVSASLAHLHPNENGGMVLWQQLSNRVAITFDRVIEYATVNTNSFQIELFYDGRIRLTHLQCASTTGLVGLSAGNGVPGDFQESDLSGYGVCALPLIVSGPTNAVEGAGVLSGQVNILAPVTTNVTVTLSSSDTSEILTPASVTIMAGMTATNFNVTIVDDVELDGGQLATISATAGGYLPASTVVAVADNETAVLSLSASGSVTEGAGSTSVTIHASAAPTANIPVTLSSSDTTELQVPATVFLPAGQTSAVFSVTIVNDTQIDGPQPVTLTAQVPNWTAGFTSVTVDDNEPTNLVVLLPTSAREGNGVLTGAGQVRILGTLPTNLLVSVSSLDPTELTVPALITIFAGTTNTSFNLTVVDDAEIDGSQNVTVMASAAGFAPGSTNLVVTDDESPQEPFNPSPTHQATNVLQTSDLAWQSGAVTGEIITNDVYFGTTPTPGPAELLGTTTNTTWDLPLLAPQTTYYWQIVARKAGITPGPVWRFTTRGVDHFAWDTVSSPQYVSEPFAVKVTAKDAFETTVTNFTGTVSLSSSASGGTTTNTLLPSPTGTYLSSGVFTLGYAFTPNENLTVTQVRSYAGLKVSIWNTNGTLLASQHVSGVLGSWTDTPLASPLVLTAGTTYRVSFYVDGNYYYRTDRPATFPHGTIESGYYYSTSDSFPNIFYGSDNTIFLCDLRYTVDGMMNLPITPVVSGVFSNGLWNGALTVLAPATNVSVLAEDGGGHIGGSNPFAVALRNDIAVAVQGTPDPVGLGGNVTYEISVTNIGPTSATGVVLTNVLSPRVALVSAIASQGTVQVFGNSIVCNLQNLGSDAWATVTIVATATNVGTLTNLTTVVRSGPDAYLANNAAVTFTTVQVPIITINDVTLMEGNAGTSNAVFTVSVSPAPAAPVTVNFATANSSASAPGDFIATNGVLNFAVGQTNRSFAVPVVGDLAYELDENFTVSLSAPVNATLADSQGLGIIRNNDAMPTLSIGDVILVEGNAGTTNAVFPVTLSAASGLATTFYYNTANGNAVAGTDYGAGSGYLSIPAGSAGTNIVINVFGDMAIESAEVFYVDLTSPANAILLKREGFGFIMNDDGLPGNADHFVWSPIPNPQYVNQPFAVVVTALDAFNNPAVNFTGPAYLSAATDFGATNVLGTDTASASFPIYTGGYAERTQVIYPASELGGAGRISAIALDVSGLPGIMLSNWTIRLKPTTLTSYSSYLWESTNWTVVYQTNLNLTVNGWAVFNLPTPFNYDGTNNLIVDFSFYNSTAYGSGSCRATSRSGVCSLYYYTSSYGNPLTWSGGSPSPYTSAYTPNLQLIRAPGVVIPIEPAIASTFTNGVWAGSLTALEVVSNVFLKAADGNGHVGSSAGFAVGFYDDVGISVTDSPDPVAVGADLTYLVRVTNSGPATATGIVVSNIMASGLTLLGVTSSQGAVVTNGQILVGNLGSLAAGEQATMTITATPLSAAVLTNVATVSRIGPDNYPANNAATNLTTVVVPALSITDVSVTEPVGGTTNLLFSVTLSVASAQSVAVNFATANGTALAGADYVATNGTLNFIPGQTNQTVWVRVLDDALSEPNETLSVTLSGSVNAVLGKASGLGFIVDNDGPPEFKITALLTNNSKVVDHDALTGDDRGGIAISTSQAFVTGDGATARYAAGDLTSGVSLGQIRDSLCTDLRTETVYLLGNGATPLTSSGGTVTTLIELNPATGAPSGVVLSLSQSFAMSYGSGIFSGYGRIVVHTAGTVYDIYVPTGTVTSRGAMVMPNWYSSETWAIWGVAEYFDGALYLTYRESSSQRIVRARVPDGAVTAVATFSNLSDLSSFVVSPSRNRWYFHHEYTSQFGGLSETLGYADAQLSFISSNPPVIVTQPVSQTVGLDSTAVFNVAVTGSAPLVYQWRKDGTNLVNGGRISGVTTNRLSILNVGTNDAGIYSVAITNFWGAALSSNAALTVNVPLPPGPPFGPVPTNFATRVSVHTTLAWNGASNNLSSPALTAQTAIAAILQRSGILNGRIPHAFLGSGSNGASGAGSGAELEAGDYQSPEDIATTFRAADFGIQTLSALDVVVCGAASTSSWLSDIATKLLATGQFNSVSVVQVNAVTPTLAELQAFDAAMVFSDASYANPTALGDVMADYVNAGGGVVCFMFENGYSGTTGQMQGRWVTGEYSAITRGGQTSGSQATLGTVYDAAHPILQGVATFDGGSSSYRTAGNTITTGSVRIADWSDGKPLVVTKLVGGVRRADLAFYPPSSTVRSDFWNAATDGAKLMANALTWTATGGNGLDYHSVYLGTNQANLTLIASNLTETTCNPGTLAFDTTYYWQVVASNAMGSVTGAVWRFTTTLDEVHFATAATNVSENAGLATITVTRENPAAGVLGVQYATTNGTATAGTDYTAVSGTLSFPAGVLSTNFQVPILNDTSSESVETVLLSLSLTASNVLLAAPSNAVLSIVDDDAVQISLFADPAYVDLGTTTSGEVTNLTAALLTKGCLIQPFTGITPAAFSNALSGATILFIPELEMGNLGTALSPEAKGVISNFVASGGRLLINGEYNNYDENFLNQIFGYSLVSSTLGSTSILAGASAGTAFAGGPTPIPPNNGTYAWVRSSLPSGSLSIYQDNAATFTTVAVIPRGAGKIIFLAYDWFDAVPRGVQDGGWDEVLRRVLLEAIPVVTSTPPVIVTQPLDQTVTFGHPATFGVVATGTAPLRYQWRKDAAAIFGATNADYSISSVQYSNAGTYSVVVSNAVGFAISSNALLAVVAPPLISTQIFNYLGAGETFVIPAGVTSIQVECWGAQGGNGGGMLGGLGGYARADVVVTPGETATIYVGQVGQVTDAAHAGYSTNAFNGGGRGWTWSSFYGYAGSGGGASDVRLGGSGFSNRVVVAGGGGGASGNSPCGGGAGGGLIAATVNCGYGNVTGGSQSAGGVGGQNGSFGQGGMALAPTTDGWVGGGGGGYYGGGCGFSHGAGAGGSSFVGGHGPYVTSATTNLAGVRSGDGLVIITWQTASPALRFLAPQLVNGRVRLRVSTVDSSLILPSRASNIWVYASTNLSLPLSNWTALAIAPVLTNGLLQVDGINPTNPPALFFRAIEGSWNVRPLRLHLAPASGNNLLVRAGAADGSPLTPIRAAKVRFYFTTNVAVPFSTWQPLANPPVLSNGLLHVACPALTNSAALYFRAEEIP
jgi:uncharacterized repeat protein (TIGR01451 family)